MNNTPTARYGLLHTNSHAQSPCEVRDDGVGGDGYANLCEAPDVNQAVRIREQAFRRVRCARCLVAMDALAAGGALGVDP